MAPSTPGASTGVPTVPPGGDLPAGSGRPPRLRALNSLRFVAASLVVTYHLTLISMRGDSPSLPLWKDMLLEGYVGVTFFFVLSGFVLMYNYRDRFARPSVRALLRYIVARVARIWPMQLLTLGAAIALSPLIDVEFTNPSHTVLSLLASATLTQSWLVMGTFPQDFNGVSWTLSIEAFLYLVFPVLAWLIATRLRSHLRLVGLSVGCVLWSYVLVGMWVQDRAVESNLMGAIMTTFPPFRLNEFVLGVCLAVLFADRRTRLATAAAVTRSRSIGSAWWTLVEVGVVGAAVWCTWFAVRHVGFESRALAWYLPVIALSVYVFAGERGLVGRLLSLRPLVFLGDVSFAIYLWHELVIRVLDQRLHLTGVVLVTSVVAVTLALSVVSHLAFEHPLRRRVQRYGVRRIDAATASTAERERSASLDVAA